jgi:hypothetical protein
MGAIQSHCRCRSFVSARSRGDFRWDALVGITTEADVAKAVHRPTVCLGIATFPPDAASFGAAS